MQTITTVDELAAYVKSQAAVGVMVYVRYSNGPAADRKMGCSLNHVTGRCEAGLSVESLVPAGAEWMLDEGEADRYRRYLAGQIRSYSSLPGKPYLLTGEEISRGSDNEPVIANWQPVARLAPAVLAQAKTIRPSYVPKGGEWLYEGME